MSCRSKSCTSIPPSPNPMGDDFDYAKEFQSLDLAAVKKDLAALMTDSQDWWPADFGHYGPLFIRMAWHSRGYLPHRRRPRRRRQGPAAFRPAQQLARQRQPRQGAPPALADQAKIRPKNFLGRLLILTGNVALETMGFKTFGFGGGREDVWEPDQDVYWGSEKKWLGGDIRYSHGSEGVSSESPVLVSDDAADGEIHSRDLENPLAAVQMGLIYVNPEGPDGNPDPIAAAKDIRDTFGRMAMNDEETVALIAGGHTFGKTHGAAPASHCGPDPEAAGIEEQGIRLEERFRQGQRRATRSPAASKSPGPPRPRSGAPISSGICSATNGN